MTKEDHWKDYLRTFYSRYPLMYDLYLEIDSEWVKNELRKGLIEELSRSIARYVETWEDVNFEDWSGYITSEVFVVTNPQKFMAALKKAINQSYKAGVERGLNGG